MRDPRIVTHENPRSREITCQVHKGRRSEPRPQVALRDRTATPHTSAPLTDPHTARTSRTAPVFRCCSQTDGSPQTFAPPSEPQSPEPDRSFHPTSPADNKTPTRDSSRDRANAVAKRPEIQPADLPSASESLHCPSRTTTQSNRTSEAAPSHPQPAATPPCPAPPPQSTARNPQTWPAEHWPKRTRLPCTRPAEPPSRADSE